MYFVHFSGSHAQGETLSPSLIPFLLSPLPLICPSSLPSFPSLPHLFHSSFLHLTLIPPPFSLPFSYSPFSLLHPFSSSHFSQHRFILPHSSPFPPHPFPLTHPFLPHLLHFPDSLFSLTYSIPLLNRLSPPLAPFPLTFSPFTFPPF